MKILLRNLVNGRYLKSHAAWTPFPKAACDLLSIPLAIKIAGRSGFNHLEIVLIEVPPVFDSIPFDKLSPADLLAMPESP